MPTYTAPVRDTRFVLEQVLQHLARGVVRQRVADLDVLGLHDGRHRVAALAQARAVRGLLVEFPEQVLKNYLPADARGFVDNLLEPVDPLLQSDGLLQVAAADSVDADADGIPDVYQQEG